MRVLVLVALTAIVPVACGDDRSVDRARPTGEPSVVTELPATSSSATPTTTTSSTTVTAVQVEESFTTADAETPPTSPGTAPPLPDPATPPPSGDGLADSITVTDSVSIVVIDPEDS